MTASVEESSSPLDAAATAATSTDTTDQDPAVSSHGASDSDRVPDLTVDVDLPDSSTANANIDADANVNVNVDANHANATSNIQQAHTGGLLLQNLSQGFSSLRPSSPTCRKTPNNHSFKTPTNSNDNTNTNKHNSSPSSMALHSCATVNFIDPTANNAPATPTNKFNQIFGGGSSATKIPPSHTNHHSICQVDLYQTLSTIFTKQYNSTLHSVPYENTRTGAAEIIDTLTVRSILTRTSTAAGAGGGSNHASTPTSSNNSGSGSDSASLHTAATGSDPAEWHGTPYCHVYIAACESMDHYRTKVRPALQAFVSQIESAANATSMAGTTEQPQAGGQGTSDSGTSSTSAAHQSSYGGGGGGGGGGDNSNHGGRSYSAQYVIVYVPIGRESPVGGGPTSSSLSSPVVSAAVPDQKSGLSFASRMRKTTQTSQHAHVEEVDNTSVDDASVGTTTTTTTTSSVPPILQVSRTEKELYRKFITDFPNGKICIMSSLMNAPQAAGSVPVAGSVPAAVASSTNTSSSSSNMPITNPLIVQEWNNFMRMMGAAIVNGFQDRCRRYGEELRKLDVRRAAMNNSNKKTNCVRFDLSHFFLVKESLAFTYEQMQLPTEALLQYDELGAFVLEAASRKKTESDQRNEEEDENDYDGLSKRNRRTEKVSSSSQHHKVDSMDLAVAGDTVGFRRRIRAATDLVPMLLHVTQYLFARETSLLFAMRDPVEIVRRAHLFINTMYLMRLRGVVSDDIKLTETHHKERRKEAELWALSTCWDVKCACDSYFAQEEMEDFNDSFQKIDASEQDVVLESDETDGNVATEISKTLLTDSTRVPDPLDKEVACKLSDLLEFARLCLLRLGDSELACANPIRTLCLETPSDLKKPWEPWESLTPVEESAPIITDDVTNSWLDDVFSSKETFETKYMELTAAIVPLCQMASRYRFAARLQAERAEIHILRGEYHVAADILLPIIDICAKDQWDRGHFWRLFRLACCHRMIKDPPTYLNTLTRCFGSSISLVAPEKTAALLQRDLEAVVGDEELSKYHLGISPFLETELIVEALPEGKAITPLLSMRRKVVKNFCSVGETAKLSLTITSHLPTEIEVDSIRLFLVSFEKYKEVYMNTPSEEDAFRVLSFEPPNVIKPGENQYKIDWTPMTTGQYILSAVEIRWKASCFFYRSCALRTPMMGIDVLPSDPTQTVELNPLFLIPGHVQPVRIVFHSGSDVITEGLVDLICSDGLQVIPPGADPNDGDWSTSCKIELPPCSPGETIVLTTSVKSIVTKSKDGTDRVSRDSGVPGGAVQTMHAKVATSYHHALYNNVKDNDSLPMKTVLQAMVTTLDRPALTVDSADAFPYTENDVFISVLLHCNTPVPFFIKEWNINLPRPLLIKEDGDLNTDLFGHTIAEGEQLSLGFRCSFTENLREFSESEKDEPILHVVLQDEFGKTFNQVLPLDLQRFYKKLREKEEFVGTNAVNVELTCSSGEGLVGAPVTLKYCVDVSLLSRPVPRSSKASFASKNNLGLFYSVSSTEMDWIIAGNVEGILKYSPESTVFNLEFVGIPTRPGVLKCFPSISLEYQVTDNDGMPPIKVHFQSPDVFKSLSFVNHMALACPAGIEV